MKGKAMDHSEASALPPSPSPPSSSSLISHFSAGRHFYVAVDRYQFKMETLVDLLKMAGRRPSLPIVVCCSSRDELDGVCAAVTNLSFISLNPLIGFSSKIIGEEPTGRRISEIRRICPSWLAQNSRRGKELTYSDLAESERSSILENFRQSCTQWNQNCTFLGGDDLESGTATQKSFMVVVTDACLPMVTAGETPLSARILINYELPIKKETYLRRISTCLAADGIVINMVVGGEVIILKGIEESTGISIAEMPINISEML